MAKFSKLVTGPSLITPHHRDSKVENTRLILASLIAELLLEDFSFVEISPIDSKKFFFLRLFVFFYLWQKTGGGFNFHLGSGWPDRGHLELAGLAILLTISLMKHGEYNKVDNIFLHVVKW